MGIWNIVECKIQFRIQLYHKTLFTLVRVPKKSKKIINTGIDTTEQLILVILQTAHFKLKITSMYWLELEFKFAHCWFTELSCYKILIKGNLPGLVVNITVWAMVLGCGFNSRVHLNTRWIRWTTWWQKKNENNKDSQKGKVTQKNIIKKQYWCKNVTIAGTLGRS